MKLPPLVIRAPRRSTTLHWFALVGKPLGEIRVAYIKNEYDVYDDEASLVDGRESLAGSLPSRGRSGGSAARGRTSWRTMTRP